MNFSVDMIPGITLVLAGAFMTFFADGLCRKRENAKQMRMLGTAIALIGAILVFLP